jgi:hypothetical protein
MIGISKVVQMTQIEHLSTWEQDEHIARVIKSCEIDLGEFVGGDRPIGDLVASVTGPHSDPLLGQIYVHTVAGRFEVDTLPLGCNARKVYVTGEEYTPMGVEPGAQREKYLKAYNERFGIK